MLCHAATTRRYHAGWRGEDKQHVLAWAAAMAVAGWGLGAAKVEEGWGCSNR